jgi:hypothetical protein
MTLLRTLYNYVPVNVTPVPSDQIEDAVAVEAPLLRWGKPSSFEAADAGPPPGSVITDPAEVIRENRIIDAVAVVAWDTAYLHEIHHDNRLGVASGYGAFGSPTPFNYFLRKGYHRYQVPSSIQFSFTQTLYPKRPLADPPVRHWVYDLYQAQGVLSVNSEHTTDPA